MRVTPNKQINKLPLKLFFVIFASLTSNISGSRQNIKNMVGNLLGKASSYLHAKKPEGAF